VHGRICTRDIMPAILRIMDTIANVRTGSAEIGGDLALDGGRTATPFPVIETDQADIWSGASGCVCVCIYIRVPIVSRAFNLR